MSDWVEVGSPPDETFASLMEGMLREAGIPALVGRGAETGAPDSLSAVPGDVLILKTTLAEARLLPEDKTGLGSW